MGGGRLRGSGSSRSNLTNNSLPSITLYTVYVEPLCGTVSLKGNPHLYFILAVCRTFVAGEDVRENLQPFTIIFYVRGVS